MSKPSRTVANMIRIAEEHAALQAERDAAVKALAAAEAKLAAVREKCEHYSTFHDNAVKITAAEFLAIIDQTVGGRSQ